ncbi:MAG: LicD family protein [Lachnospiraceae bacterium]|nr:LicD family protein [Lachnospiraceae bacterium]
MYDLTKVHQANLSILKEIDRICRKYKLKYVLDAGTLIGAVRHKGFIPWDDDADVAMTRANIEAFIKVAPRELPEGMELVLPDTYHGGHGFYDFTPRIIYKNSRTHEEDAEMAYYDGKLNHVYVDLFILDALPDCPVCAKLAKGIQTVLYGLAMGHRYHLDFGKYSAVQKVCIGILASVGKIIPLKWIMKLQRAAARKDRKKKTKQLYYSNYQPDYLYVTLDREWSTRTVDLPFEDTKLMCPEGWHEVLTLVYGDYMKFPPKEQQVPSHSTVEIQVFSCGEDQMP